MVSFYLRLKFQAENLTDWLDGSTERVEEFLLKSWQILFGLTWIGFLDLVQIKFQYFELKYRKFDPLLDGNCFNVWLWQR